MLSIIRSSQARKNTYFAIFGKDVGYWNTLHGIPSSESINAKCVKVKFEVLNLVLITNLSKQLMNLFIFTRGNDLKTKNIYSQMHLCIYKRFFCSNILNELNVKTKAFFLLTKRIINFLFFTKKYTLTGSREKRPSDFYLKKERMQKATNSKKLAKCLKIIDSANN